MTAFRLAPGALALLMACNPFSHKPAVEVDPKNARLRNLWNATLATPAELAGAIQMRGSATMGPISDSAETRVTLTLANATPGGTHPWEVHQGQCGGTDGGMVGSSDAYEPVKVDSDGRARESADLKIAFPESGDYFVEVYAAASNRETVVACGNFAPPTG